MQAQIPGLLSKNKTELGSGAELGQQCDQKSYSCCWVTGSELGIVSPSSVPASQDILPALFRLDIGLAKAWVCR